MRRIAFVAIIILTTCLPILSPAATDEGQRPKIGLVLSGGGARGAAHVGVLKVLEELRIPIDYVAGTSMGAVVGGLYASGMTADQIEHHIKTIDWDEVFDDEPPRPDRSFRRKLDDELYLVKKKPGYSDGKVKLPLALVQGQKFDLLLNRLTADVYNIHNFDDLPIPFRAVATNIETGQEVVLKSGNLARALRASMAVPGAFAPVEIDGAILVDGGIANNLPIDLVREMGADILIVVNISTPLLKRDEITSALSMVAQLVNLLGYEKVKTQLASLGNRDILISPELSEISSSDFKEISKAIPIGTVGAEKVKVQLAQLRVSSNEYNKFLASHKPPADGSPTIQFVKINNNSNIGDETIKAKLSLKPGDKLDYKQLDADIGQIYGLDIFQNVRYEVVEENSQTGIVITAEKKAWGPDYLQFGIALSDNLEGDSSYNLGFAYTRTAINSLNGEWRTALQIGEDPGFFTEIYQPLDAAARYFINARISAENQNLNVFRSVGDLEAEYRLRRYGITLAGGRNFGTWGELRLGVRRDRGDAEVRVGSADLRDLNFDSGRAFVRLSDDKLDDAYFPRHGHSSSLEYRAHRESLGDDNDFEQTLFNVGAAHSWGRNTFLAGAEYNTTHDSDAPIYGLFRGGGFFNLSGFVQNELSGQHYGIAKVAYYRKIGDLKLLPAYLGASLEYGGVWQDDSDIFDDNVTAGSIFLGLDTPIGAIYTGYGHAEGGNDSIFLFLGQLF